MSFLDDINSIFSMGNVNVGVLPGFPNIPSTPPIARANPNTLPPLIPGSKGTVILDQNGQPVRGLPDINNVYTPPTSSSPSTPTDTGFLGIPGAIDGLGKSFQDSINGVVNSGKQTVYDLLIKGGFIVLIIILIFVIATGENSVNIIKTGVKTAAMAAV